MTTEQRSVMVVSDSTGTKGKQNRLTADSELI